MWIFLESQVYAARPVEQRGQGPGDRKARGPEDQRARGDGGPGVRGAIVHPFFVPIGEKYLSYVLSSSPLPI